MGRTLNGFSLIETMSVLGIAALGLTLALPSFEDTLRRNRVTASMQTLMADLAMARGTAIMRNTQILVCPATEDAGCARDHDWTNGWIVFIDKDGDGQPAEATDVIRASAGPGNTRGLRLRSTRPFLRYQENGRSAHSNLTVNVCAGESLEGKLIVNNLGRVRSERPAPPTPCPSD